MAKRRAFTTLLAALVFSVLAGSRAQAVPVESVIKFGLGETGPDLELSGGRLHTTNQLYGGQFTNVDFVGPLSDLTDILSNALFNLSGVELAGSAQVGPGGTISEQTKGGWFSLYSPDHTLLLAGVLSLGTVSGSLQGTTGAFFADFANLVGGTLLQRLAPYPVGISIALSDVTGLSGLGGMPVICPTGASCRIGAFVADGDGIISASAEVPEPFTAGLLLSGLVAGLAARRRAAP